jgi:hypothetical protein
MVSIEGDLIPEFCTSWRLSYSHLFSCKIQVIIDNTEFLTYYRHATTFNEF